MQYYYAPSYLRHHGVKGMKWGVRRYQKKDGTRTALGKKRREEESDRSSEEETEETAKKRELTKKQKAALVGAAVVAAYATYKFVDSGSATRLIAKGKEALKMSESGFKKNENLSRNMDVDELFSSVVSRINPDYGDIGTKMNCRRCTFAYEMSRRGFDVKATRSVSGTGQGVVGWHNAMNADDAIKGGRAGALIRAMKNPDFHSTLINGGGLGSTPISKPTGDKGYSKSIFDAISKLPEASRGELTVSWKVGGSHSMAWEIVKGKPVIFDCQTGNKYDSIEAFTELGDAITKASMTRLDNVNLNSDFLKRWLQNA